MLDEKKRALIAVAKSGEICLLPRLANRHGLITGATGTGKTVTLQTLAETFSQLGVPVFAADVKGDLSGVAARGGNKESVIKRVGSYKLKEKGFTFQSFPVEFWDVFGMRGAPMRARVSDMGPLLLGRLLNLNDTQSAVLTAVFKIAADEKLELIDLKDLRKILEYAGQNSSKLLTSYGNPSAVSIGAIQRGLITLEHDGADQFFGEPALNIDDLLRAEGERGVINILAADQLMRFPKTYGTLLLWLLNHLFEALPEVGDPEKPRLVFFFDEAHLLFADAPTALRDKIEQIVRLIRSKGVGVYFISQTPADLPDSVLGQLGNRIQHALRAYTPKDQKALKAAAESFRANPDFDTTTAIAELGIGEALVSLLDEKGAPSPVERAFILPPQSQVGPLDDGERARMLQNSLIYRHYAENRDRVSAYEVLSERQANMPNDKELAARKKEEERERREQEKAEAARAKAEEKARREEEKMARQEATQSRKFWGGLINTAAREILGGLLRGGRRR